MTQTVIIKLSVEGGSVKAEETISVTQAFVLEKFYDLLAPISASVYEQLRRG